MNKSYLYLGVAAVLYGSIATLAKPQLTNIHPILLSSSVYLIIGIVLTILTKLTNRPTQINRSELKYILIISIFGAVLGPILYFYGLMLTSASLASILINIEFVFSILLAMIILKEKPNKRGVIGILLIFTGLIIVNINYNNMNIYKGNTLLGNILIVIASLFWALDNNLSNIILKKGVSISKIIQLKSLIGGTISFCICIIFAIPLGSGDINQIPFLIALSLGGFACSLYLFLRGMKEIGTIKAVMIFSTSTIFGIIFALIFLNESSKDVHTLLVSSIFVIGGIYFIIK
ncbi:DMT family transporter [Candidatus Nitrosocosmicus hydrocola]|uniref:DMT family transporter n=1 Tax=Candidatus Nitrosocosmicus hydrocola TaxID=1826872 RepID=UPI0013726815|nr:DMT family transporter [Candidatus Nitrosocosmicus hydrocola]